MKTIYNLSIIIFSFFGFVFGGFFAAAIIFLIGWVAQYVQERKDEKKEMQYEILNELRELKLNQALDEIKKIKNNS